MKIESEPSPEQRHELPPSPVINFQENDFPSWPERELKHFPSWPERELKDCKFINLGIGKAIIIPNYYSHLAVEISREQEKLQTFSRKLDNFIAEFGQEVVDKFEAQVSRSSLLFEQLLDAYTDFHRITLREKKRIEFTIQERKMLSTLNGMQPAIIKPKDRIPVPKKYSRNRFRK